MPVEPRLAGAPVPFDPAVDELAQVRRRSCPTPACGANRRAAGCVRGGREGRRGRRRARGARRAAPWSCAEATPGHRHGCAASRISCTDASARGIRIPSRSMEHTLENPVVVEFPLRGEDWMAVTTPAHRVPSHGTDMLGQRYAYDFLKVDRRSGVHFHPASTLRGELFGGATRESYAWGASIHAPFDAEVVHAVDGMEERQWIHPARELAHQVKNAVTFTPEKLPSILGNHVILRATGGRCGRRRVRRPRAHGARLGGRRRRTARVDRRPPRPRRPHGQLDEPAPALPADGLGRADDRAGHRVRVPRLRGRARRRMGAGRRWGPRPPGADPVSRRARSRKRGSARRRSARGWPYGRGPPTPLPSRSASASPRDRSRQCPSRLPSRRRMPRAA